MEVLFSMSECPDLEVVRQAARVLANVCERV
jgi:hypothetical protein